jgi:hypothetical protein
MRSKTEGSKDLIHCRLPIADCRLKNKLVFFNRITRKNKTSDSSVSANRQSAIGNPQSKILFFRDSRAIK